MTREAIAAAYRVLGLAPGVSPLAAKRRYRELIKLAHPDRHSHGSPEQAEATRRTQEINDAYRTLRDAALHREVPLRRPAPAQATAPPAPARPDSPPPLAPLSVDTVGDRITTAVVGLFLGALVDLGLGVTSTTIAIALPLALGIAGAALGWRAIEAVIRALWWIT